ncbi:MAG: hypothetical protein IJI19_02410, partial [Ruminococcus sp.]|nr:hypothetical protein [Ruminococcus sp.]
MIQKTKRPISILLVLLMIVGMFSVLPISAGATSYDSGSVTFSNLQVGDTVSVGVSCFEGCPTTLVLKGGTYGVNASEGRVEQICNEDLSAYIDPDGYCFYNDNDDRIFVYEWANPSNRYFLCNQDGTLSTQMVVLAKEGNTQDGVTLTVGGYDPASVPVDYYVVGTMNSWAISEDYKMVLNENNTSEYWIQNVPLHSGDEIKVVSSTDGSTVQYWYPDGTDNNLAIGEDGYYNVYVAPAGHNTWHYNCILATKQSDLNYVAQIGSTKYETLADAFAAAVDGDIITLLADCTGDGIKVTPAGKFANGLTVDFAGHTYTVDGETVGSTGTETNGFQLLKDNKVTFQNGTITSAKAKILVQNYSDLTLDGMTLTLNNPDYTQGYTLSNNNGNIVIDDTTINANPAGGFAFDVCRYASYPSVNVTVKGDSVINGDVEIFASKGDAKDGFSLTLESGTMTGDIVLDQTAKNVIAATPEKAVISKEAAFDKAAPADYKWDANGVLVPCDYVAQVGTAKYESLTEAIAAAQDGDTVTLLADITLPAQSVDGESSTYGAYITKSLTIDGDGHTVTSAAARVFGVKGTQGDIDVTFKNITVTDKEKGAICVCTRGGINSLTLDNATLSTQGATKGYIQPLTIGGSQATQAKVNVINGSTIQTGDAAGKHYAIILWNPVDLTIQDSTIKGWACVYQKAFEDATAGVKTEVTIDNSTLISKGIKGTSNHFATIFTENADFTCEITNTTMDITAAADTYQAVAASNGSASGFEVKLGAGNNVTLTGDTAIIGYNFDDATHEIAVSGGTFNKPVAEYYCAEGFIPATLDEETGKYSVKTGTYVAEINGVKYETLAEAFAAAVDGDTITLLANCAGNGIKVTPAGKFATNGLTVDFNGHTYTVDGETVGSTGTETNGFQLLKNNKVTFTNGTITSAKAKILVQNYSDLTLEGMTLTLNNPDYTSAYTLSNNNGNIVIDGTTINANPAGGFAFDVCRFSSYPSVHVTVKGDSQINGNVEISASKGDAKQGFSLTLESGAMTGDIVVDASAQALVGEDNKVTKADTFTQTAPEGFKWVDNGDNTASLAPMEYVAEVVSGNNVGKKYETVNDAIAAAGEDGEVKLIADITGNVGIGGVLTPYNTTLDLNGHTITNNGGSGITLYSQYTAPATFTIKDSSPEQTGGISITKRYYGDACISDSSGRHVVIEGGTYTSNDKALYISSDEGWTINGGTFNGKIFVKSDVEITDGTFHDEVVQDSSYDYSTSPATEIPAEIAISGGTFDNPVPADFCADGYIPKDNGDGTYTVVPAPADLFVGYGLSLQGDIGLIFYLDPAAAGINIADVNSVAVDFDCDHYTYQVTDFTKSGNYIKVTCYVPAAYMAHDIEAYHVKINDVALDDTDTYSVQQYAERIIEDP